VTAIVWVSMAVVVVAAAIWLAGARGSRRPAHADGASSHSGGEDVELYQDAVTVPADDDSAPLPPQQPAASDPENRPMQTEGSLRAWLWGEEGLTSEFLLASTSVRIGRDPRNDVVLPDQTVSREHALLDYSQGGWWLLPGITSNGTSLNGAAIQPGERLPVGDGDRLRFGLHTLLRLRVPAAARTQEMRFAAAARTALGRRRENQDAHLATAHLLVVADGLSDRPSPGLASRTAIQEIAASAFCSPLRDVIARVNDSILGMGNDLWQVRGMAATLDLVRLNRDEAFGWRIEGAHLGDGQVLLQDRLGVRKLTREDTPGGHLSAIDPELAEQLSGDPEFHNLTLAVGFGSEVEPSLWSMRADVEQRLVLTTDGLIRALGREQLTEVMWTSRDDPPAVLADRLVRMAIDASAEDNVTVIVADVTASSFSEVGDAI
jgi:serine/threonine protein phosphatase PrpC